MLGLAEGCFEATIPYTLERKQFNQSIYDFQVRKLVKIFNNNNKKVKKLFS